MLYAVGWFVSMPPGLPPGVATIITAVPTASPSAVVDRLCNMLGGMVPPPQHETVRFSTYFAIELHRELCEYLFCDTVATFGQLDQLDNTIAAFLRFFIETLTERHCCPSL